MRDHTGCAGIMIGRGAFGNPWLFRDGRCPRGAPTPGARRPNGSVALEHARPACGSRRHPQDGHRVSQHLGWYTKGLHGASDLRQRLYQIESMAEAEAIFLDYLEPVAAVA
jgi:tRNA-dihydrouridine synthase